MVQRRCEGERTGRPDLQRLWDPLHCEFSGRIASSRLMKAAMSERLSSWTANAAQAHTRGVPSRDMVRLYEVWGHGRLGVILTGNIMVDYDNLEAAGNPIIARDCQHHGERFERFREVAKAAKAHGSLVVAQLNHAGRQVPVEIQPEPISASEIPLEGKGPGARYACPRAATREQIDAVVHDFVHAACFLAEAGYDGVQLHAAHGYLLAQFLSANTNHRDDDYGGHIENRLRIVTRIGREIRRRCPPNFILSIKLNSVEFDGDSFTSDEAAQLCRALEDSTFDFVELSGGTYAKGWFDADRRAVRAATDAPRSTAHREAYFLEFAHSLLPHFTRSKVYITGGLRTAGAMVDMLDYVDGIGLARPLCLEPHLAKDILEGRVEGAVQQRLRETAFALSASVAGAQMWQLGAGRCPIDLSVEENERLFRRELERWAATDRFGYVKLA